VELNRAVAVSMAFGPAVGLELVDELVDVPAFTDYHLLPSVRGDMLARLGRQDEAAVEFERAASLTRNERERVLLVSRAAPPRAGRGEHECGESDAQPVAIAAARPACRPENRHPPRNVPSSDR
jgi:hypothetical protein